MRSISVLTAGVAVCLTLGLVAWRRPTQAAHLLIPGTQSTAAAPLPDLGAMPELAGGTRWFNSRPLSRAVASKPTPRSTPPLSKYELWPASGIFSAPRTAKSTRGLGEESVVFAPITSEVGAAAPPCK